MLKAYDVVGYFLAKDPDQKIFNKKVVHMNGRGFYEGNARLNKYLHLAQNFYIAMTGNKLFKEDLYAYDNGAVEPSIVKNYAVLLEHPLQISINEKEITDFLDRVYVALQNATLEELIELSHEDPEWQDKHEPKSYKPLQPMDSLARADEYRKQYADMVKVIRRMSI